ncbi:glutathione S-transferase family protein [Stigmatella sp. ncwal1]|uniref:Glutathione S-transferase family protein n=1 Tax=Stigmatella ashevillensis TaxID=2995309 RepID=A0ABT5DM28_9BACT|nr:glutathione S-transferase family protein [Stigmatella ashevillena]MDC0714649.1 glutathione S-transferase family protein [Stigmatella ashevillena]
MGLLVDGQWKDQGYDTAKTGGRFEREASRLRNWITADGVPGPDGEGGFRAEPGRYHLYISWACPWAHRTMILRSLKGLEEAVSFSVTHWKMAAHGWSFEPGEGVVADPLQGARYLYELYVRSDPHYTGRVSVPMLWDKKLNRIVNNESADILRMFNSAFNAVGARPGDYYPERLRGEIDAVNTRIYNTVNNGVYKAGFASTQQAYEDAVRPLFETLDWLEARLRQGSYLCGEQLTEADWRLFTTLVRFDSVYVGHFKCNLRRLIDYPNLWAYTRELYQMPGIRETVHFGHIKRHYYESHPQLNPSGIVPLGPLLDFDSPPPRRPLG